MLFQKKSLSLSIGNIAGSTNNTFIMAIMQISAIGLNLRETSAKSSDMYARIAQL